MLPSMLGPHRDGLETGLVQFAPGVLEALRRQYLPALETASLAVTAAVERPELLPGEAISLLEDRLRFVGTPPFERRSAGDFSEAELLEKNEVQLPKVCPVPVDAAVHRALLQSENPRGFHP